MSNVIVWALAILLALAILWCGMQVWQ